MNAGEQTATATLDVRTMREALIEEAAEKRGIEIGMCLAAAILVRDFDYPSLAEEILGAAGLDIDRVHALPLDEYDLTPLLQLLAGAAP